MRFWCATIDEPWTWQFKAYPGIWAVVLLLSLPYLIAVKRRRDRGIEAPDQARRTRFYFGGVLAFWLATDWPLGLLGASYLASAHMAQFMIYTLVAAPLMLLGLPEWMARQVLGKLRIYRLVTRVSKPLFAGLMFNGLLLFTHAPWTVDVLRSSQWGSFVMDMVWLAMGFLLWAPIISPLPEMTSAAPPVKVGYIFLAAGVVPMVPAGFLTFAPFPLYSTYELAPRFYGLAATTDQQIAGLIMKIGGIPVVWGTMLALMIIWMRPAEFSAGSVVFTGEPAPEETPVAGPKTTEASSS